MANLNNLLFDDNPLICSPQLAALFGNAEEAIILQQIHYWLKRTGKMQKDGHKWFYNSMANWMKQFPWIRTRKRLTRYFDDLEERGLIVTGNFSTSMLNRTKWYRIDYDALNRLYDAMSQNDTMQLPKKENAMSQNDPTNGSNRHNGLGQNDTNYNRDYTETTTEKGTGTRYPDARNEKSDGHQSDKLRSFDLWEQNWGFPNGVAQQDLTDWINEFGDELVAWTIEFALRRNISSHGADSWLMKAFDRYRQEGVTTVEQAAERAEQHRQQVSREIQQRKSGRYGRTKRVEKLPDWAQNKPDPEPRSQSAPPDPGLAKPSAEQLADTKKLLASLKAKHKKQKAGAKT